MARATAQVSGLVDTMKRYTYMDQAPLQDVDVRESLENTLAVLGHRFEGGVEVIRDYEGDLPRAPVTVVGPGCGSRSGRRSPPHPGR